jgi:hypothetical protein
MTILHGSAALVVAAVLLGATPAVAGKPNLMPRAGESVTPMASGQKQFQVTAEGVCAANNCLVKFGKKGKVRRVTNISCLLISAGEGAGGIIDVEGRQITYLPVSSRAMIGVAEYAMAALAIEFDVAAGEVLQVILASGTQTGGSQCIINGTME